MAMKSKHSDVYRDSWKPLLQSTKSQSAKDKKKWIHDDKDLLFGSILYKAKHLGTIESENVPDNKAFMKKSATQLYYKNKGKTDVEIAVSVRSIIVTDTKTKIHICKQKLQRIMICSEDRSISDKILAFVVRKAENQILCYCFETQVPASRITLSVGQAFDLAQRRSQDAKEASIIFAKEMKKLKAMKGKENYAKKLEEMMSNPDSIHDDILPEMNYSKSAKRISRNSKSIDVFESWQQLTDTIRPLRDADDELPSFNIGSSDQDLDAALAQIQEDLHEWNDVEQNPTQVDVEVTDALNALDDVLGSDSQTLIGDTNSKSGSSSTEEEFTKL